MYPEVEINIDNIVKNAKLIEKLCGNTRSLTLVTKLLAGNIDIVKEVINKTEIKDIADSHVSNLKLYKELPVRKWLIREPGISEIESVIKYVDISFNSELDTIKALNTEAKRQNKIHNIILTYELGDLREGCNKEELFKLVEECMKLENVKIYGIGANLSCFGGIIPTEDNMKELKNVSLEVESKFNIDLTVVSGANTSAMHMLKDNEIPEEINNIRIGEAILCGYNTAFSERVDGFNIDTFKLKAEIVEIKNKQSIPRGISLVDAAGNKPEFEDRGIRTRAIIAIGNEDVNIGEIKPVDKEIVVLGGCSDYTILDITDSKKNYKIGDIVEFNMSYFSILKSMISKYVYKNIIY